jgi:hypothetical protein
MADPVKITAATPQGNAIDLTFKRWFQTREFWISAGTIVAVITPIAIDKIDTLGFSPRTTTYLLIALIVVRELIGMRLKAVSKTIVLGKDDYHAVKDEAQTAAASEPMEFSPPDKS